MARNESAAQRRVRQVRRRRRRGAVLRALVVAGLLAGAVGVHRLLTEGLWQTPPAATPAPSAQPSPPAERPRPGPPPAATLQPEGRPAEPLPALDESDALVRKVVSALSSRAELAAWLVGPDLIRRFVAAVDNVAEGNSPRRQLSALAPGAPFRAREVGDRTLLDPRSYARYDVYAEVFASLDTGACLELYARLEPLLREAYVDLGHPDGNFDSVLVRAIDELRRTPVVEGELELEPRVTSYELRDPDLEALSPAQKHLLRMGPDNTRRIQSKLGELRLGLVATPRARDAS